MMLPRTKDLRVHKLESANLKGMFLDTLIEYLDPPVSAVAKN